MKKCTDKNCKNRTINGYNLNLYDCIKTDGCFEIPSLDSVIEYPKAFIGFNEITNSTDERLGVHFYLDDYQFERIWKKPSYYLEKLRKFKYVLTPDFSLFVDSFKFCFDGLPQYSVVSISSVGVMRNKLSKNLWVEGVEKMIETIKPKTILLYGEKIDFPYKDVEIIQIPNSRLERIRKHGR